MENSVQTAKVLFYTGGDLLTRLQVKGRQILRQQHGLSMTPSEDLIIEFFHVPQLAIQHDYCRPQFGQGRRDGPANASGGPGYHDDLAGKESLRWDIVPPFNSDTVHIFFSNPTL